MLRPILFVHRWLGIIVGLLMTIWCLSGFVMMYVGYPRLTPAEQLRGLAPLQLPAAQKLEKIGLSGDTALSTAKLEMMGGRPILRLAVTASAAAQAGRSRPSPTIYDLRSGQPLDVLSKANIESIAQTFGRQGSLDGPVKSVTQTGIDQWTIQTYRRNAPLYRVDYADSLGTQVYISAKSGEVVQTTTRTERFWNWLGAVPHYLYPTILRQNAALWTQVIIWTASAGCFLTLTGLWTGIARLRRTRDGSIGSPYRGLWWWHHIFGLFFGILTLTWVASGLLSMRPWGILDTQVGIAESENLAGTMHWKDVSAALSHVSALPAGTVRLVAAAFGGQVHLLAINKNDDATRFNADGRPAPLNLRELTAALDWAPGITSLELLREEDAYYYGHTPGSQSAKLPVWRAILSDSENTRLYVDPQTGRLLRAFDRNERIYRWAMEGLHYFDLPGLRIRPFWNIIVTALLVLVTIICGTGTWMGVSKVRRDLRRVRNRNRRRRATRLAAARA